jgi:hypothetical protein
MEELKKRDFRRIVSEFEARTVKARTDLEPMKDKAQVLSDLAVLGEELVSLGGHFLSDDDLQRLILKHLKTNKKN